MADPNTLGLMAAAAAAAVSGPAAPVTAPIAYGATFLISGAIAIGLILWLPDGGAGRAGSSRWSRRY